MNEPLLSIIIPVYNTSAYLVQCLESIVNQSATNYEILLINDGSTDGSGEICDRYSIMYKYIKVYHKKNEGLSLARNYGLNRANGIYVWYLDSDDYLESNCINHLCNKLINFKPDLIMFNYKFIYNNNTERIAMNYSEIEGTLIPSQKAMELLLKQPGFSWYAWSYITKRDIIVKNNLIFKPGILFEDVEASYKYLLSCNKILITNTVVVNYRFRRTDSITKTISIKSELDKITVISKNILTINKSNINYSLKRALNNNFSLLYYNVLIMFYYLPLEDRYLLYDKLVDYQWVCEYTFSYPYKQIAILIRLTGIRFVSKLLYLRSLVKRKRIS